MGNVFMQVLNMSFVGSGVILCILALRLILRRAPKKYSYCLWAIALVRLSFPVTINSVFSLIHFNPRPFTEKLLYDVRPKLETGIEVIDQTLGGALPGANPMDSFNPMQSLHFLGMLLWCLGLMVMLLYGLTSFIKLRSKLKGAYQERDRIYVSKTIQTPFVMGILSPRIYLPDTLEDPEKHYVVLHEQMHIRRFDPMVRVISYLILCLHWFNPLVWLAYGLSERDMEMSCDELVLKQLGPHIKKAYAQSLLHFAVGQKRHHLSLLAFGEGELRGRVKNILEFKQPKMHVAIGLVVLVGIAIITLVSNPIKPLWQELGGQVYQVRALIYADPVYSFTYFPETAPRFNVSSDNQLYIQHHQEDEAWTLIGGLNEAKVQEGQWLEWVQFPDVIDAARLQEIQTIRKVYRATSSLGLGQTTSSTQENVYIFAQTDGRRQLVFYGNQIGDRIRIRWIFAVEAQ